MSKETYYFQHDYEPTSDPKIQALIGQLGATGYGLFWRIVEMLHSCPEHKLPFKDYIYVAIAKQMQANAKQIKANIQYCISTCELFEADDDFFWSNRVFSNFEERGRISKVRANAGRLGGLAKKNNVIVANAGNCLAKRSKGKERKDKENTSSEVEEKPFFAEEKLPKIKLITKDQFEIFWEIYPRKDGKGKALTNWNNLCNKKDRPEWKIVRTAIYEQIKTERWKNPKFIPLPATWINQKRWIDDPKAMTSFQDDTDVPFPLPRGWPSYKLQDGIKYSWDCQLDGYRHKNGNLMIE